MKSNFEVEDLVKYYLKTQSLIKAIWVSSETNYDGLFICVY